MTTIINFIIKIFNFLFPMQHENDATAPEMKPVPESHAISPQPVIPVSVLHKTDVTLRRTSDNGTETLGVMTINESGWSCITLELPWKDNQHNISCIPAGIYKVSMQPFHDTYMYQILDVPGRTGIFIHPGNYFTDILGCILQGINPSDINHDGQIDVTNSKPTVDAFKKQMNGRDFTLEVINSQ